MSNNPVIDSHGTKWWYINGKLHRVDGPAIEYASGSSSWWMDGEMHRLDGPAVEWVNGDREWWIDGKQYSFESWLELIPNKFVYLLKVCYE